MNDEMQLGALGQIARHVADVPRAEAWYRDVLGLAHLYTYGDLAFFDCDGTRLMLSREARDTPGEQNVLYFRVDDIHTSRERLIARGAVFVDEPRMIFHHPDGTEEWMTFFRDCEGQLLALMEQRKPG